MDLPHLNVAQLFIPVTTQVTYSSSGRHAHSVCYPACVSVCMCVFSGWRMRCLGLGWPYILSVRLFLPCVFTDGSRWSSFLVGGDKNMLMESQIGPLWTSHGSRAGSVQHTTSTGFPINPIAKYLVHYVFTAEFSFCFEGAHPIYIKLQ